MYYKKNLPITIVISALFILPSTDAISESDTHQKDTYEKQNVQKLESGRTNQLKSDADLQGRTEENKGNFDTKVPRGDGVEYPPAKGAEPPVQNPGAPSEKRY